MEDPIGEKTLEVVGEATNFNKWMFETIEPFCRGHILEIGSGLGNISRFFLEAGRQTTLSDLRPGYRDQLVNEFNSYSTLEGVENLDLVHPQFEEVYSVHLQKFDSVFALNVVEHIEDDQLAIRNAKSLLRPGGNLIVLVPSYNSLYNGFDLKLGHFRRYTISSLAQLFYTNNLKIINRKYFNLAGIPGWYISGKILNKETIPRNQMRLYNQMVPLFKIIDQLVLHRAGLSTIIVGKKLWV